MRTTTVLTLLGGVLKSEKRGVDIMFYAIQYLPTLHGTYERKNLKKSGFKNSDTAIHFLEHHTNPKKGEYGEVIQYGKNIPIHFTF